MIKKKIALLLLGTTLFSVALSGCGKEEPVETTEEEEAIGGDWRVWRGYTEPYRILEEDDVVFSRFSSEDKSESFGYAAYENTNGIRIGAMVYPGDEAYTYDTEADGPFYNQDLDGDGTYEIGIPFKDGTVVWYGYDQQIAKMGDPFENNPFLVIGIGDKDGIKPDREDERGTEESMGRTGAELLPGVFVAGVLDQPQEYGDFYIDVYDTGSDTYYGHLMVGENIGMDPKALKSDEHGIILYGDDVDGDGKNEIGLPFSPDEVFWYHYDQNDDPLKSFTFLGVGTENGFGPAEDGVLRLSDTVEITCDFGTSPDFLTIDIFDKVDGHKIGTIQFNDNQYTANDIVYTEDIGIHLITKDLNHDGFYEVGVPMLDGIVYWYSYEDGEFLDQGAGTPDEIDPSVENNMLDTLFAVLGEELDGMMVMRTGTVAIDGMNCEEYAAGTDHTEHFVVEAYYAAAPDGSIYKMDVAGGGEYKLYK